MVMNETFRRVRFTSLVDHLLTVPHEEIQKREAEYRKQVDANPHRRGPKRKKRKAVMASMITSKAAIDDHPKTGQREAYETG